MEFYLDTSHRKIQADYPLQLQLLYSDNYQDQTKYLKLQREYKLVIIQDRWKIHQVS